MPKKITPKNQIKSASKDLQKLMQEKLTVITGNMIDQMMRVWRNSTPSGRLEAMKVLEPVGIADYKATLIEALAALSNDAIDQARLEIPKAAKIKLDEFSKLTPELQRTIKARADALVGKQVADMKSTLQFAYMNNQDTTDSEEEVENELDEAGMDFMTSSSVSSGADVTASTVIADARDAFFFDKDVLEEIEAFEFVNEDPVTEICTELAGTIFAKDDPDLFKYTPPLHWGCKSWIRPILRGELGDREITKLKPSASAKKSIQFSDVLAMYDPMKKCC